MAQEKQDVVLVTGASAGIGKATAEHLAREGYKVYGAARRVEAMRELESLGGIALKMDICNAADIESAVARIEKEQGRLDVLINNAGYAANGAFEDVPMEEARRQFEVNIFGLAALTQRALPGMRARKHGAIVNVSSIGGKMHTPITGWYHATKYALEALSDTLRVEVAPFGIKVIIIEPGAIATEFVGVATAPMLQRASNSPYKELTELMTKALRAAQSRGDMSPPELIARTISKALKARQPKTRYVAGKYATTILTMRRLLSDRMYDRAIVRFAKNRS